jgi:hypothetical protein
VTSASRSSKKTMNVRSGRSSLRRAAIAIAAAMVLLGALASGAAAATPAWKLLALTGPTYLQPKQSEIQRVLVNAEGGGHFRLGHAAGEGLGTPVSGAGHLTLSAGSAVATIESVASGLSFEVGARVTGPGLPSNTTVLSCSADCSTTGSTATLSEEAEASEADEAVEVFTKRLSGVSGTFQVGEEISSSFPYFPPHTEVTAVGSGTLILSAPTTSEYLPSEGEIPLIARQNTVPIAFGASPAEVGDALEALSELGPGSVSVVGGSSAATEGNYFVEFIGPFAEQGVELLSADSRELNGQHASIHVLRTLPGGPGTGEIAIDPSNIGGSDTVGEYTVEIGPLPPGVVTKATAHGEAWNCSNGAGEASVTCTSTASVPELHPANNIIVPIEVTTAAGFSSSAPVTIHGGNARQDTINLPITVSKQNAPAGVAAFWAGSFDENGLPEVQAGGYPYSAMTYFMLNTVRSATGLIVTVGDPKNVIVNLPPGFTGNPLVTKRCPQEQTAVLGFEGSDLCPYASTSVGQFGPSLNEFGSSALSFVTAFQNDVPPRGYAAEFTTRIAFPLQSLLASIRSSEDYGVRITAPNNPNYARIYGAFAALEGHPEAAGAMPFLRNATSCQENAREAPVVKTSSETWQEPYVLSVSADQTLPPITGCEKLEFHPTLTFQPTNTTGSSGTGAAVDLHIPQEGLAGSGKLSTPDLKRAVVKLPPGLVLNPSSANGLQSCSEAQIGLLGTEFALPNPIRFNEEAATCPEASKLGTVEVESPLTEAPLVGTVYLAAQEENPFHSLLALYLVVDDARTGILLKLPGELQADPSSGQLTATFDYSPQLPFHDLKLNFRGGGARSELATPEVCGHYATTGSLTPWSAPESGPPAEINEPGFDVNSNCANSAGARPFSPAFEAGTAATGAGAYTPLVVKVNRKDGEQELSSLNFTLPKGLIGKLAGIPYCSDEAISEAEHKSGEQEAANSSCPAASQLGSVTTAAGVGSEPFQVGGHLYLAGPYKGAPISSVVITPALAGPFDLGNVVVRAPLYIDHETAALTVKSDPIPTILKGFQLKLRSVSINIDKPGFILNPTNCTPMTVSSSLASSNGGTSNSDGRFQVGGCEKLKFAPKLKVALKGGTRRNGFPALTATLTQPAGQANIGSVSVALPHSEFLEQGHIRTNCTRVQFAAEQCPKGSIYGHAEAVTPLLDQPLRGPVYLRSSNHKLPDLVAALKGPASQPIEIDLDGRIDSIHGGIRTTFETVPDAPVSKFVLRMQGGKKSLLVNSTNICRGVHKATVRMTGQNALLHNTLTPVKAQCGKKSKSKKSKKNKHHTRHQKRGRK